MPTFRHNPPATQSLESNEISPLIEDLLAVTTPHSPNQRLYQQMLETIVQLAKADRSRWNAKITLQTLKELDTAFGALAPFDKHKKITVFGSARTATNSPLYKQARQLGQQLAAQDMMVVTGAGGGIMAAAHEGAGLTHSIGLNITLPFEQSANATVQGSSNLVTFHFFFLRKLFFIKEAAALVLCPGGFGTLDEALEILTLIQTGKSPLVPLVLLDLPEGQYWTEFLAYVERQLLEPGYILASDLKLVRLVHSAEEAVQEINQFYRNYHSSRWVGSELLLRMQRSLNVSALQAIQHSFADICLGGDFQLRGPCPAEANEPDLEGLTRLAFMFNGRDHGRLRELIDFINQPTHWQ